MGRPRSYTKVARAEGEERTREALLEAADEAFLSGPWAQVSLDTIARDAGVTKQTLLRHLLGEYLKVAPADVRAEREAQLEGGGFGRIRFAWWGSLKRN